MSTELSQFNGTIRLQLNKLEKDRDERVNRLLKLTADYDRDVVEWHSAERVRSGVEEDKTYLSDLVGRGNDEITHWQDEVKLLDDAFNAAQTKSVALQIKVVLVSQQKGFNDELAKRDNELMTFRREMSNKELTMRSGLDAKAGQIRALDIEMEGMKVSDYLDYVLPLIYSIRS